MLCMNSSKLLGVSQEETVTLPSHELGEPSQISSCETNPILNNYAIRFKLKNCKNKFKT
jgi:hypothetical protein